MIRPAVGLSLDMHFSLCRAMEHTAASTIHRLARHLNPHNILNDLQHGFGEGRSCETRLVQLFELVAG